MNVARSRELSAFYFPDRVALIFKDRRWTYRELDMEASALASSHLAQQLTERLSSIQSKLDRLLDAHLDEVITLEEYVGRKEKLLHEKAALTARMVEVERRGNPWLELLEGFIKAAHQAQFVACGPNLESLKDFSKRIGSNLRVAGQTLSFSYQNPWPLLAHRRKSSNWWSECH